MSHVSPASSPRVSVVLPAWNAAATLSVALESLAAQTLADFEVLVVDDGSVDATPEVVRAHSRRDPRFRLLSPGRVGLARALNLGLAQARAAYVARMDADDRCLPARLARQAAFLDAHPDVGLVSCQVVFDGDRIQSGGYARHVDWVNSLLEPEAIALNRFRESPLAHPSVLFRAGLVTAYGGYADGLFPEDYELWLRWLERGVVMAKLAEPLLEWRDDPARLSRTDQRYAVEAFHAVKAPYLARWLARHNPHHPDVLLIGAGRVTRKRADLLLAQGVRCRAYVDIDPRKVGKTVHGRPVWHREALPEPGECFAVSFLAGHDAGEDLQAFLEGRGWVLGRDFILAG